MNTTLAAMVHGRESHLGNLFWRFIRSGAGGLAMLLPRLADHRANSLALSHRAGKPVERFSAAWISIASLINKGEVFDCGEIREIPT